VKKNPRGVNLPPVAAAPGIWIVLAYASQARHAAGLCGSNPRGASQDQSPKVDVRGIAAAASGSGRGPSRRETKPGAHTLARKPGVLRAPMCERVYR